MTFICKPKLITPALDSKYQAPPQNGAVCGSLILQTRLPTVLCSSLLGCPHTGAINLPCPKLGIMFASILAFSPAFSMFGVTVTQSPQMPPSLSLASSNCSPRALDSNCWLSLETTASFPTPLLWLKQTLRISHLENSTCFQAGLQSLLQTATKAILPLMLIILQFLHTSFRTKPNSLT